MAAEFVTSAGANTVGNLTTEYASPYVSYFFRFGKIVEEFKNQRKELELKKDRVKNDVNEAMRQTEAIEEDVLNWLESAEKELEETQSLEVEIERKKRFNWFPNWGYSLSKKVAKKTLYIKKLLESSNFQRVAYRAPLQGIEFFPSKDFMLSKSSNSVFNEIIKALNTDCVNMIGLYGMPGVGKTTLAKEVGTHAKEQFDKVVMVTMTQTPNINQIQDRIAELLGLKFEAITEKGKAEELWCRLKGVKKILVIIDDVWNQIKLETIGIPFGVEHDGCKVLLTTRLQQVCVRMNCQEKFQLHILSEDEAWALFKDNAGLENVPSRLNDVAKEVARECKGLPLAIVTVGKALKGESLDGWEAANQRFKNSRHVDNEEVCEGIYNCLKLSYDCLKEDIRSCFLLCSLFPEDFDIPIELLIMLGIGYGLFSDISSIEERRWEICEALRKLQDSGLLLKNDDNYVSMHDVVRDFAHWRTSKEKNIFMFKEGLTEWPISESFECYTAISFWNSNTNTFPDKLEFRNLKFFVFTGNVRLRALTGVRVSIALVEGMKALQVLHLKYVVFSLEVLEFITNLRTLCFEDCELENISSLKNLENLEILVLSHTNIYELPEELLALRRLKSLHFCSSGQCNFPPNLLSRLTSLQELHVTSENNVSLSELNSLSGLTALSLRVSTDQCVWENFVFHKLQRYNIDVNGDFLFLKEPTFRTLTRTLTIRDFSTSLSAFKELFCNVEKLVLKKVMEHKNIVPNVDEEGLKELTSLELSFWKDLECLIDTTGEQGATAAFSNLVELNMGRLTCFKELCHGPPPIRFLQKLTSLNLWLLPELEQVFDFSQEVAELEPTHRYRASLQSLKAVKISQCNKLKSIFSTSVVQSLLHLEELIVAECDELEQVFDFPQEVAKLEENQVPPLSNLTCLELSYLSELKWIWKGPNHLVNLRSLKIMRITWCLKLPYLFPAPLAQGLVHLEVLEIQYCDSLKHLIIEAESDYSPCLSKLRTLRIMNCESLKYVFPITLAQGLVHLEVLEIQYCDSLEHLIIDAENDYSLCLLELRTLQIMNCERLKYVFPITLAQGLVHLEVLEIRYCDSLEHLIIEAESDYFLCWSKLRTLRIMNCKSLNYVFPITLAQGLVDLEELNIRNCDSLEHLIIKADSDYSLCWSKLRTLRIMNCKSLKYVFSITLAQGLMHLEELKIWNCDSLEHLIIEAENDYSLCWSKLRILQIMKCKSLKYVFPITLAQRLPCLESVWITNSSQLKQIFNMTKENVGRRRQDIVLPRLQILILENLENLCSFCPENFVMSLKKFTVSNCPRLTQQINTSLQTYLENVRVMNCGQLQEVFQTDDLLHNMEEIQAPLLSNLTSLELESLPELKWIWKGPSHYFCLQRLKVAEIRQCNRLKYLFSPSLAQSLVLLEQLKVVECNGLEHITTEMEIDGNIESDSGHLHPPLLPKLTSLEIHSCPRLEYVFKIPLAQGLPHLVSICITNAPQLKQVFNVAKEKNGVDHAIALPRLQHLQLENLINLSCVCSENYPFVSPSLQKLTIGDCPRLLHFTIQPEVNKQVQLKKLQLFRLEHTVCEKIFQIQDGQFLLRIEVLYLKGIYKLQGPIQVASPQYLRELEVSNCNRLKSLFSYMLARNLLQLRLLRIELCEELEEIIEIDQTSIASSSQGYLQPISFPSLEVIWIEKCCNLKSLFPISVARSLSNLSRIEIQGASKLKQVFGYEGELNVEDDEKGIVIPELEELELLELPSLTSFAPMGYNFPFPSLNHLEVRGCPYLITRFSNESRGIMHAITEAPRQVEHNTAKGLTTTEEIVDNLPTCNDISWYRNLEETEDDVTE